MQIWSVDFQAPTASPRPCRARRHSATDPDQRDGSKAGQRSPPGGCGTWSSLALMKPGLIALNEIAMTHIVSFGEKR